MAKTRSKKSMKLIAKPPVSSDDAVFEPKPIINTEKYKNTLIFDSGLFDFIIDDCEILSGKKEDVDLSKVMPYDREYRLINKYSASCNIRFCYDRNNGVPDIYCKRKKTNDPINDKFVVFIGDMEIVGCNLPKYII